MAQLLWAHVRDNEKVPAADAVGQVHREPHKACAILGWFPDGTQEAEGVLPIEHTRLWFLIVRSSCAAHGATR